MIAIDGGGPAASPPSPPGPQSRTRQRWDLHIPVGTILKLVASALALWAAMLLWPGFLLFLTALLLAVTLYPSVLWMEGKGVARGASALVIAALAIGAVVLFVLFLVPPLSAQMSALAREFPEFRARILSRIPTRYPMLQDVIRELVESASAPGASSLLERSFAWGQSALSAVVLAVLVAILTVYLLVDGVSLYAWLLAFIPRTYREKLATTASEVSGVVHAFVSGQLLAALLFALFTGALLMILRVPGAVPLAVLAGLCNVIPVLGILLAILPAALLALAVSPGTAAVVVAAYLGYHLFETYFLLPRIYGNKLKISTLSVLLALLVGGRLQGIIGAVLVLPLVAAYPIIERHWLSGYLRSRVLTDHKALAKAAETGSEVAIDAVLLGERHASEGRGAGGQDKTLEHRTL